MINSAWPGTGTNVLLTAGCTPRSRAPGAPHGLGKGEKAPCQHQNYKLWHSGFFRGLLTCMPFLQPLSLMQSHCRGNTKTPETKKPQKQKNPNKTKKITRGVTGLNTKTMLTATCGAQGACRAAKQAGGFSVVLQGALRDPLMPGAFLAIRKSTVLQQGGCQGPPLREASGNTSPSTTPSCFSRHMHGNDTQRSC